MEEVNLIKQLLKEQELNIDSFSDEEKLHLFLTGILGIKIDSTMTEKIYALVKCILPREEKDNHALLKRLNELRKGDINFDDFSCSTELADYIEYGD